MFSRNVFKLPQRASTSRVANTSRSARSRLAFDVFRHSIRRKQYGEGQFAVKISFFFKNKCNRIKMDFRAAVHETGTSLFTSRFRSLRCQRPTCPAQSCVLVNSVKVVTHGHRITSRRQQSSFLSRTSASAV